MQHHCARTPALLNQIQKLVSLHAATVVACCLSKEQKQSFSVLVFTALFFVKNSRHPSAMPDLRQHQTGYTARTYKEVHAKQLQYNDMIKYKDG